MDRSFINKAYVFWVCNCWNPIASRLWVTEHIKYICSTHLQLVMESRHKEVMPLQGGVCVEIDVPSNFYFQLLKYRQKPCPHEAWSYESSCILVRFPLEICWICSSKCLLGSAPHQCMAHDACSRGHPNSCIVEASKHRSCCAQAFVINRELTLTMGWSVLVSAVVAKPTLQRCENVALGSSFLLVSPLNKVWISLCKKNEMWGRICSLSGFFSNRTSDGNCSHFGFYLWFLIERIFWESTCSFQVLKMRHFPQSQHSFGSSRFLLSDVPTIPHCVKK